MANFTSKAAEVLDGLGWFVFFPMLLLVLAPFTPEPHVVEKLRMLSEGTLAKPIDIFDLLMHGSPILIFIAKVSRTLYLKAVPTKRSSES